MKICAECGSAYAGSGGCPECEPPAASKERVAAPEPTLDLDVLVKRLVGTGNAIMGVCRRLQDENELLKAKLRELVTNGRVKESPNG